MDFPEFDKASMKMLCQRVLSCKQFSESIAAAQQLIDRFDAGILEGNELTKLGSHNLIKLARFCLPFFEIRQNLEGTDTPPEELAAVLLWFMVWRPLDNLLDGDGPVPINLAAVLQAFSRAERFHISTFGLKSLATDLSMNAVDNALFELRKSDRRKPNLVYMRAIVQETPIKFFAKQSEATLMAFRSYINALGIIHDAMDVLRDTASHQETPATAALRKTKASTQMSTKGYTAFSKKVSGDAMSQFRAIPIVARQRESLVYLNINNHYRWFRGEDIQRSKC